MSWKLDNIDFSTYGVGVTKAPGLFDMPKLQNDPFDWLDEDGVDYWQADSDLKFEKRTFNLYCYISAETYADFLSKLKTFYNVVISSGKRTLSTPYGLTVECYLDSSIDINHLDRGSRFINSRQAGVFVLNLTVPGDSEYILIPFVYWTSATGTVTTAVAKTKNLKITKDLQGDASLSLSFESNTKLDIHMMNYVNYFYNATNNEVFLLLSEPPYDKLSTNKYAYNLTLHSYIKILEKSQFLNDLGESDFSSFATMEGIVDRIITNHGRTVYGKFTKGTVVSTPARNHKFSAENCLEVLKRITAEYELEFEFEKDGANFKINIKEKVANDLAVTFEYGKGKGLYNLKRGALIEGEYFNRLFAFGSSKNLPQGYRNGLRRLSFTANPLEDIPNTYGAGGEEKEATIYFEDIYPRRTSTVSSYEQTLEGALTAAEKEVWPNGMFVLTDLSIPFDINDYLLGGLTAKIVMKTGDLAGYEFDISKYDHDTKELFIIPFKDERGEFLPDENFMPAPGDEYTLINIDLPESYVTAAENELQAAAVEALAEGSAQKYEYTAEVEPKFVRDNNLYFEVGDRVTIVDADYGVNGTFRISRLVFNDYTGKYELTFSEKRKLNRLQTVEQMVNTHDRAIEDTKSDTVESIRDSKRKVEELNRILLDPIDEKLNADKVVRNNSIDPGMMALDAGEPDFYPHNSEIIGNYGGNEDAIRVTAGKLVITNWYTKSRYEIAKMKAAGQVYDPSRSWDIPLTDITLENKNPHALYAKLTLEEDSTVCEIVAFELHTELKAFIEDGYLLKRIATISAGEEAAV